MIEIIRKRYPFFIVGIVIFILTVSVFNAKNDSAIYDETAHIPASYSYLTEQDMRLNPEHPPLIKDLSAIPLLFFNPKLDTSQDFWNKDNANDAQWNAGKSFLYNSGNNPDQIIFWSRIPLIILAVLLGLFIFKWLKELAGVVAGIFGLTLYAFDPNILGHNHFVTTDLGIAAFTTFCFYYFIRFIKLPTWKNVILSGIFLGLMQLTKFSSVIALPVICLVTVIYPLVRMNRAENDNTLRNKIKNLGGYIGKLAVIFLVSLVIVYIAYYFNMANMPKAKTDEAINYYYSSEKLNTLGIYTKAALLKINEVEIARPMAEYLFGIARVFQRVAGGNQAYFFGEVASNGFFWYFPTVFTIKEPLPILFLLIYTCIVLSFNSIRAIKLKEGGLFKKISAAFADYLRFHIVEFLMITFIILYFAASMKGGLNIGFRHLFPVMPFLYILIAKNLTQFIAKLDKAKTLISSVVFLMVFFLIFETIGIFPYYMSYFNQLVGGPKNGYHFVTDSNTDWGQDLKRLSLFMDSHPEIGKIKLDYFGITDLNYYLGDRYTMWWDKKRPIETGWYAISVLFLQESIYDKKRPDNESYRWLTKIQPTYQVGTSILIYHVTEDDLPNQ